MSGICAAKAINMPKPVPSVVLDSCCIIELLQNDRQREDVVENVRRLLVAMNNGEVRVTVSDAVAEEVVLGHENHREGDDKIIYDMIDAGLEVQPRNAAIMAIAGHVHEMLNFRPRDKMDAVHLATAIYIKADRLYTTDERLIRQNEFLGRLKKYRPVDGFEICEVPNRLF